MGGADEARGEGVEREGSSETLAGQARRVEETELLEAGGHHSHQGNLCLKMVIKRLLAGACNLFPQDEALEILKGYREKIVSGDATFDELASEFSDCSSARNDGDLGPFGRGQMQVSYRCGGRQKIKMNIANK